MTSFTQLLSTARLAVINTGGGAVYKAFRRLYPHHPYPVAYMRCRVSEVAAALALCEEHHVFALVLGAGGASLPAQPFSAAVIAPSVSLRHDYFRQLVEHPSLKHLAALAFQAYLTPPKDLELLKTRYFETLRLGVLRENLPAAEPLLRDADYLWFDVGAIRAADAPRVKHPEPNGLYAEEACKLLYYAALSNHAKALFLYGYSAFLLPGSITARLIAQLIWHLADGLALRIRENLPEETGDPAFKEIMVDMGVRGQELYFLHSAKTQRWWMKIPHNEKDTTWIACAHSDYQTACRGEVPTRWLRHHQKLNC